jgi:hypothetical protein
MTHYVGSYWQKRSGEILQVSFKDSQITENGAAEQELGREGGTDRLHAAVKVFVQDFTDYKRSTGKSYCEWHVRNSKPKS